MKKSDIDKKYNGNSLKELLYHLLFHTWRKFEERITNTIHNIFNLFEKYNTTTTFFTWIHCTKISTIN